MVTVYRTGTVLQYGHCVPNRYRTTIRSLCTEQVPYYNTVTVYRTGTVLQYGCCVPNRYRTTIRSLCTEQVPYYNTVAVYQTGTVLQYGHGMQLIEQLNQLNPLINDSRHHLTTTVQQQARVSPIFTSKHCT